MGPVTVGLTADADAEYVWLSHGSTLNLNGHILNAGALEIDSADGLVAVNKSGGSLQLSGVGLDNGSTLSLSGTSYIVSDGRVNCTTTIWSSPAPCMWRGEPWLALAAVTSMWQHSSWTAPQHST